MKLLLTIAQAAEAVAMSEGWIKKALSSGELGYVKLGKSVRIEPVELERCKRSIFRRSRNIPNNTLIESAGVYFLLMPTLGAVKIGCSQNIKARVAELQGSAPEPLEVMSALYTQHARSAERWFHRRFAKQYARGEWFRISRKEITEAIRDWRTASTNAPIPTERL